MKKLIAAIAIALAVFIPVSPHKMQPVAGPDYGSGQLGDWTQLTHATFGNFATADVVIVGDSITMAGWNELQTTLNASGYSLAGSYWAGRPTTPAVDWTVSLSRKPPILVMASGTNDIFNPPVMAAQVARLKAWAGTSTRILWVDVQASRASYAVADQRNSMWVNQQIWTNLPASNVCQWSRWFAEQPPRLTQYLSDGVHPIEGVGTNFWAAVIKGCVTR